MSKIQSSNLSANVSNLDGGTSRINWASSVTFNNWYYYGVRQQTFVNGGCVADTSGYTTGGYETTCEASGSNDFSRGHSAYNIGLSTSYWGETVDGYGSVGESGGNSTTVTIPAKDSYGVSYNANGGSSTPAGQTKWYGENLTLNGSTSREGYTFQYWKGSDGGTYYNGSVFTGNYGLTLTAVWAINTWGVSYNANGGSNAPSNQTKVYGQTLTLSSAVPTRTLYDFVSWAGSDGNTYYPNSQFTGNYGLTLTANWKLAYIAPTVSSLQAYHCDSAGVASDSGKYIHVIVDWSVDRTISSTNQGSGIKISCNGADYTIGISGQSGKTEYTFGAGGLDYDTTYAVTALVYDTYMGINYGTSKTINAQGAKYAMDIAPNGHVCFGGSASDDYHICVKENGTIIWHN